MKDGLCTQVVFDTGFTVLIYITALFSIELLPRAVFEIRLFHQAIHFT